MKMILISLNDYVCNEIKVRWAENLALLNISKSCMLILELRFKRRRDEHFTN